MATYDGFLTPHGEQTERPNDLAVLRERASPQLGRDGLDQVALQIGTFTDNLPVTLISDVDRAGHISASFFTDYYNRVYFLPPVVQFGPISTTAEREVLVWNAYLEDRELETIVLVNGEGLALDGEVVPFVFRALESTIYTLIATTDGSPELDADVVFTFDSETYVLEVTGSRAKVAPFVPNWKNSYTIDYQFKTEILKSRAGKEQRRALRQTPRKSLSFTANPRGDGFRAFNELMAAWQNNIIVLPEVPRAAVFDIEMLGGDDEVVLTENAPDWVVPEATVLLTRGTVYETRRIATVSGDEVTFAGSTTTDWPEGTKMHPALAGRVSSSMRSTRETNAVATVNIEFAVVPASEPVIDLPVAPVTFNGRELFTVRPNWGAKPDVTYEGNREDVDYDRGRIAVFTPIDFLTRVHRYTFTGRNYTAMAELENHFRRMAGQRGEFYMPTWENDIEPIYPAPAGANSLRISGQTFAGYYEDSTVHRAVAVFLTDGTVLYNVVQDIYPVDDTAGRDSVVQCTDPWGVDLTADNVKMICWLLVWRHATDTLSIEWLTNSVGQCQMTLRSLEDLT